ncbi:hypothetical protein P4K49_29105 [Bacillus cereus]|uniref:hypothetical protein n=1 Tax=Bacillus cereus group TaxID=86661 RepID=UPI000676E50A|nr:hypothetical protein [Bacillus thuringiensis]AKR38694.1 Hypothetical protein NF53_p4043 [Bacillus thuringiensis serovar indiana]MEB8879918.1 hypothetical protein [Bacillus cereus]MEB9617924.1 hypothetical protein [Bacillus cereus]MEB9643901.1 hypothetical protein [Bacillus cereus]MEB9649616.1 hypothetical protein [Bacillus cereus]
MKEQKEFTKTNDCFEECKNIIARTSKVNLFLIEEHLKTLKTKDKTKLISLDENVGCMINPLEIALEKKNEDNKDKKEKKLNFGERDELF